MTAVLEQHFLVRTFLIAIVTFFGCFLVLYAVYNAADEMSNEHKQSQPLRDKEVPAKLVCYFDTEWNNSTLRLKDIDPHLCSHIHIGPLNIKNNSIEATDKFVRILSEEMPILKEANANLKFMLWVGGGGATGFSEMVKNHGNRKTFLKSCLTILRNFSMNGLDYDWEFPRTHNKERQHFSQLLYETRTKFENRNNIRFQYELSIAVAAPEGIAYFAYDVREINQYADYVNLMTYDFHFYSEATPFTGFNASLYAGSNEGNVLATLNINYSVNWWLTNGLDRNKLIVGLPTYGHSFTLVNPLNFKIGAPARAFGRCGINGFTTYSDICRFKQENPTVTVFDAQSCSPYLHSVTEWVSFENEQSLECKANFVKNLQLGGVMIFSLNTDDIESVCNASVHFPLIKKVKNTLL